MKNMKSRRFFIVLMMCLITFMIGAVTAGMTDAPADPAAATETAADEAVTAEEAAAPEETPEAAADEEVPEAAEDADLLIAAPEEEAIEEEEADPMADALDYVDNYADNLDSDPDFETNIENAIGTIREEIKPYATFWALLPALIAIGLALITKEVYSSLVIGIVVGGILYAGGSPRGVLEHVIGDGFIGSLADSYNMGIIFFLVLLGALVAMMNKAGGSAAFGRWATKHIKSRVGAQLATIALGVLIFIDDYFNCLTVGSVMRPVTDGHKISRAKLAYLIDATAAPVCIIAPISSWAAAVAGFARGAGADSGMSLFIKAIPFNFYALLTIVMMIFLAISGFDYGPMKKHEINAKENGDLFTSGTIQAVEEMKVNEKGKVIDLVLPVLVLIVSCVIGMVYSGGIFDGEGVGFIEAFSNSDASIGLAFGAFVALIITVIYFIGRRVLKFKDIMESFPEGFKAMVSAILILTCAWTLKSMTDSLGAKIFISQLIEGSAGSLAKLLPAIIFVIAVGLSFATGTSWGTFGILIPIVLSVFHAGDPLTVAGVSAVAYVIAGFVPNAAISLPVGIVLMIGTLFVLKIVLGKKKA